MEKKPFYITLQTGLTTAELRDDNEFEAGADFDFEIRATEQEAEQLQDLLMEGDKKDFASYIHSHIPYPSDKPEKDNDDYDRILRDVYQRIYELGTAETRANIEQMGVLKIPQNVDID